MKKKNSVTENKEIQELIKKIDELVDETGSLLCIVTHDESIAERVAGCRQGRRLCLSDGRLVT